MPSGLNATGPAPASGIPPVDAAVAYPRYQQLRNKVNDAQDRLSVNTGPVNGGPVSDPREQVNSLGVGAIPQSPLEWGMLGASLDTRRKDPEGRLKCEVYNIIIDGSLFWSSTAGRWAVLREMRDLNRPRPKALSLA